MLTCFEISAAMSKYLQGFGGLCIWPTDRGFSSFGCKAAHLRGAGRAACRGGDIPWSGPPCWRSSAAGDGQRWVPQLRPQPAHPSSSVRAPPPAVLVAHDSTLGRLPERAVHPRLRLSKASHVMPCPCERRGTRQQFSGTPVRSQCKADCFGPGHPMSTLLHETRCVWRSRDHTHEQTLHVPS